MTLMRPVDDLAEAERLDAVARPITALVGKVPARLRDLMHGTWLGHPVHPILAYVPVGTWLSASALDVVAAATPAGPAREAAERSAQLLLGIGLAGAPGAAAAGWVDWADLHEEQQRIGLAHAAANGVAIVMIGGSWLLRRAGRHGSGRVLGLAGMSVAGLAASIGGHLSFHWAAGVNHAESVPHVTPGGWQWIARIEELPQGPSSRAVGTTPVCVIRRGDDITVLADECSHLSGPLSEGELETRGGEDCIVCPWHGAAYRLSDGAVVGGPAIAAQPQFDVRIEGGAITARVRVPKGVAPR